MLRTCLYLPLVAQAAIVLAVQGSSDPHVARSAVRSYPRHIVRQDPSLVCPTDILQCVDCSGQELKCTTGDNIGCPCKDGVAGPPSTPLDCPIGELQCVDCGGQDLKCTTGDHIACPCEDLEIGPPPKSLDCPTDPLQCADCSGQELKCTTGDNKDCPCVDGTTEPPSQPTCSETPKCSDCGGENSICTTGDASGCKPNHNFSYLS
jgi:hypothetical protein